MHQAVPYAIWSIKEPSDKHVQNNVVSDIHLIAFGLLVIFRIMRINYSNKTKMMILAQLKAEVFHENNKGNFWKGWKEGCG